MPGVPKAVAGAPWGAGGAIGDWRGRGWAEGAGGAAGVGATIGVPAARDAGTGDEPPRGESEAAAVGDPPGDGGVFCVFIFKDAVKGQGACDWKIQGGARKPLPGLPGVCYSFGLCPTRRPTTTISSTARNSSTI